MPDAALPHLIVVGGGFSGLWAIRALRDAPVRITLIDRRNHHLIQPRRDQVATAGLSSPDIAAPLRHILRHQRNVEVWLGEAERVDALVADGAGLVLAVLRQRLAQRGGLEAAPLQFRHVRRRGRGGGRGACRSRRPRGARAAAGRPAPRGAASAAVRHRVVRRFP